MVECKSRYNKAWYERHSTDHKANVQRNKARYDEAK
jgi:hypothetical protein